ncbi:Hsp70 family protein [Pseudenhygromyxa sp. WMMC2535]|uniref:Hsp70 family protein n=1 Tax=Pseudenhygromyxa sp. WMMC2535 TaxID=2712867 RepID=UPI00155553D0|nr:Hsp70 family protein [Pseudenhygromyxa sp. WMMC2535]NVB36343.1 Hsp70 family protein [Pseudenhygromyxa sp. WMMC2535]
MSTPIVGIDLGTTNSLVAIMRAGQPVLLPSPVGSLTTPSAVSIDDSGELLVGEAARARALTHPQRCATNFKRDMGTSRRQHLGELSMSAPGLSALVLTSLQRDAEAALGEPVTQAVITVPAYFGDLQRQATRDAASLAGIEVLRFINEPTAAALAYGLHRLDQELRALVLDLGGGTFDVTVLEIIEGVIEIQASAGDARLGGEDFAEALVELLAARIAEQQGVPPDLEDPQIHARLLAACERAKRRLSAAEEVRVPLPDFPLGDERLDLELSLTRADAEAHWQPLLARLRGPINRALTDAELEPSAIDEVLLVGGATRMPCLIALAARIFGRMPNRSLPPDEAVAMGAAIQAALIADDEAVEDLVVTDIAPFSMGVETSTRVAGRAIGGMFSPVLERGTVIPASRIEHYLPLHDAQDTLVLRIYQGEHALVRHNTLLGEIRVPLPRAGSSEHKSVGVRFTYDLNGILEIDAIVEATGDKHSLVIEQRPGALTASALERARAAMQRLKFHPRESLPNRTTLARADALHVQLRGAPRALLREQIQFFEVALSGQEPREIEQARESLQATIEGLSRFL